MPTCLVILSHQSISTKASMPAVAGLRPQAGQGTIPPCPLPIFSRCGPVVAPLRSHGKCPLSLFPLYLCGDLSSTTRGGTPTPLIQHRFSIGRQRPFSLTPVFATHPENASVTPFLATLPKTHVLKVVCLPHIQKMAGVGCIFLKSFGGRLLRRFACVERLAKAEPQPDREDGKQGAGSVDHGIVGGRLAARDKELMNFVQGTVSGGDGERREAPGPAPTPAGASHATIEQKREHKIFRDMGHLANDVVNERELRPSERRNQPAQDRFKEARGMLRGKGIRGHDENNAGPRDGRPPGAQPAQLRSFANLAAKPRLNLLQLRRGTWVAPGLSHRSAFRCKSVRGLDSCAVIPSGNWAPRA